MDCARIACRLWGPFALRVFESGMLVHTCFLVWVQVFALGMLSVFLSAPLGAILLKYFGPKLLKKGRRSSTGEDAGDH